MTDFDPRLLVALISALGVVLLGLAVQRLLLRRRIRARVRALGVDEPLAQPPLLEPSGASMEPRALATRLGERIAQHLPSEVGVMAARADRAGLAGRVSAPELLGWKVVGVAIGLGLGLMAMVEYGAPGALMLLVLAAVGWFGVDLAVERYRASRRRAIMRDLPTVMDLLVLSMEAGLGLERALRTIVEEYRSPLADELHRVLADTELGLRRGEAFERMAQRVGLEDLRSVSRAIVQSEELGVSLVTTLQTQSRDVRVARRRLAEAEALRAPVKMLFPLVLFILPTLFMLLLGPVGLRAGAALSGVQP